MLPEQNIIVHNNYDFRFEVERWMYWFYNGLYVCFTSGTKKNYLFSIYRIVSGNKSHLVSI